MKLFFIICIFFIHESRAKDLRHNRASSVCRIIKDEFDQSAIYQRNFVYGKSSKWPNNEIPYVISKHFSQRDLELIKRAMLTLEKYSCVKWIKYTNQNNYVIISSLNDGCYANLGFQRYRGKHELNLQRGGCMNFGIVLHEMLHILGFSHEQNRPDRDQYIKINWENIESQEKFNFFRGIFEGDRPPKICDDRSNATSFDDCYSGYVYDTYGLAYEYESVMHYGRYDFSRNGFEVIVPLQYIPPGVVLGQRRGPTSLDLKKLYTAYSCDIPVTHTYTTEETTPKEKVCKDKNFLCGILKNKCQDESVQIFCKRTCDVC